MRHPDYQPLVAYHDFVRYNHFRNEPAATAAQEWDMTMRMKAASSGILSKPLLPHLGQHFLEVAEEARADGNEELAIHFIELALEAFDEVFGDLDADPDLSDISEAHEGFFNAAC